MFPFLGYCMGDRQKGDGKARPNATLKRPRSLPLDQRLADIFYKSLILAHA